MRRAPASLFILPGFLSILALSIGYATFGQVGAVAAVFAGLKPAVLAIVLDALIRLGKRALPDRRAIGYAAAAFVAIFVFAVPFPVIIVAAGLVGALSGPGGRSIPADPTGSPQPAATVRPADSAMVSDQTYLCDWGHPP